MIRVTPAALAVTLVTRPTSPAPFTTASYTCTPLVLPTLIVAVEYQAVVGRATTRPVTSRTPLGKILWSRSLTMARSSSFSACVVSSWATPTRSCSTSFLSSLFSDFALKRSPAQFQASRNGLVDRAVPFCSGATTRRTTLCAPRAMPLSDSRKYNVSMATESSSRIATTIRRRSTRRRFISQRRTELPTPRPGVALALDEDIELLEILAGAHSHARERRLRQMHRHLRLFAQALGQTLQQRPAAGEHDPAVHDVAGKLRRRLVEGRLDGVDDRLHGLFESSAHFFGRKDDRLGQTGHEVAAADLGLLLLRQRVRGADLELDLLRRLAADQELVLLLDVTDDGFVEFVAADTDGLADDDAAERDDGHLAGAAADVDDHAAGRLGDRQAGADGGRHGLFDEGRPASTRGVGRLFHRSLFDAGHTTRDADDHPGVRPAVLHDLADEMAQHLLGDIKVGDDAVFERPHGADGGRRAAEHALGLRADGVDLIGAVVDGDHGRLAEHDAPAAQIDQCVGGTKVDRHVASAKARHEAEEADQELLSVRYRTAIVYAGSRHRQLRRRGRRNRARAPQAHPCATAVQGRNHEKGMTEKPASASSSAGTGKPTTLK